MRNQLRLCQLKRDGSLIHPDLFVFSSANMITN